MADLSTITLPNGNTYDIKDAEARRLIASMTSFEFFKCTEASNTPQGAVGYDPEDTEKYIGTLVPSSTTTGKIYLVFRYGASSDAYDEYVTLALEKGSYWSRSARETVTIAANTKAKDTVINVFLPTDHGMTKTVLDATVAAKVTESGATVAVVSTNLSGNNYTVVVRVTTTDQYAFDREYDVTVSVSGQMPADKIGYIWERLGTTDGVISNLGKLAYADKTIAVNTPAGGVSASFSGTSKSVSVSGTPSGTLSMNACQPTASGSIGVGTGTTNYTPEGSVASSFTGESKDYTSKDYTPGGTVSQPDFTGDYIKGTSSFTGSETTSTGKYKPEGSITNGAISITPSKENITPVGQVGSAASWSATVEGENLIISWTPNTPTSAGTAKEVLTGITSVSQGASSFSGTEKDVSVKGTPSGSVSTTLTKDTATTKDAKSVQVSGSVSKPTFSGTKANIVTTVKPEGSVSSSFTGTGVHFDITVTITAFTPTGSFSGNVLTSTGSYLPEGTVSATFTGTQATIIGSPLD